MGFIQAEGNVLELNRGAGYTHTVSVANVTEMCTLILM